VSAKSGLDQCSPQPNGETITYFHNDLVGSPVAATDASGTIVWRESYRAYGDRLTNRPDNGTVTDRNGLHFSNKKTEALKGGATMSYFGARYYDPAIGRFLSVDPMYFSEASIHSFNRYAYANNNPYRFVDPDGNQAIEAKEYSGLMSRENAERAAQYWADKHVQTENVLYAIPGVLAVMWANNGPEIMAIAASTRGGGGAPKGGLGISKIDRNAFRTEREAFWKNEAKGNASKYSADDLAKMEKGRAPTGNDGHPMELHHTNRTQTGGIQPMTRTEHRLGENYKINHPPSE
jgi:RHS repeat-associated protein